MNFGTAACCLVGALAMTMTAGCTADADGDGAGPAAPAPTVAESIEAAAGDSEPEPQAPESRARIVASLPESSVVVVDPGAASRSERVAELAESVGATLEGDTARIVVAESVLFEFGSAELLDSASDVLDDIADLLTELAAERIDIVGHTDAVGTDEYNLDLSARRAAVVENALGERGVDGAIMEASGRGEAEPIAPNENADGTDDPDGRARNRRVEVTATGIAD